MDALSVAAFEERAKAAEARLALLESAIFGGSGQGATSVNSAGLAELKEILTQAREEAHKEAELRDKLKYQVLHLKRALEEADKTIAALRAGKA